MVRVRTRCALSGGRSRAGVTLIELLVSIGIMALLVSLVIPAVQAVRESARRSQCTSNLHNLGTAILSNTDRNRRFPPSGRFATVGGEQFGNWVVDILPDLEQLNLSRAWDRTVPRNHPLNAELCRQSLPILVCPSDGTAIDGKPNLSYAVNGGLAWTVPVDCPVTLHLAHDPPQLEVPFDLNGNGILCPSDPAEDGHPSDRKLLFQLGLFFGENEPLGSGSVRHHRHSTLTDGHSNTIMLAETLRVGFDPALPGATGWSDCLPERTSFFVSGYVCENLACAEGSVNYQYANDRSHPFRQMESLNSGRIQAEGQAPWPTSHHEGGVFFLFADTHTYFASEQIDGTVYVSLVSPQGAAVEGPLRQASGGSIP